VSPTVSPAAETTPAPATGPADACLSSDAITAELLAHAGVDRGDDVRLPIAEVAELTGVTAHTLRYYERIGLVDVPRDAAGRRRYRESDVARVVFITRLRLTAMPIRDIQAYFRLVDAGAGNEAQRLAILQRHRAEVRSRLADLQAALSVVDVKIAMYGGEPEPSPAP
jgi:DNA-binding transcriptional MerR regulator